MKSVILLFILLSKTLPLTINYPNNKQHLQNANSPIKLCLKVKYTTNDLQARNITAIPAETSLIKLIDIMSYHKNIQGDPDQFIFRDSSKACGVEIYKNQTSGLFIFDYNIMPLAKCNNAQNSKIICNMDSNCNHTIKCCDLNKPFCINTFTLKKITSEEHQNDNYKNNSCITNNNTECFSIVQTYEFKKSADVISNKTTKAPSNDQQSINVSFLQLLYLSLASFFITL